MKNYRVKYQRGHLLDIDTGKRIFLKRGGEFAIQGDNDQFEEKDEVMPEREILDSWQKWQALTQKYDEKRFYLEKIANAGTKLYYRIGISNQSSEDTAKEYVFDAYLLEDLYIRTKNGKAWYLCDCFCESKECVYGDVQMIENIKGYSLSNLFSNMVAFYFTLQRSGATNAFKTFHFAEDIERKFGSSGNNILTGIKNSFGAYSLDQVRQKLMSEVIPED